MNHGGTPEKNQAIAKALDRLRLLPALQSDKLGPVQVILIKTAGKVVFVTEELFRILEAQEELALLKRQYERWWSIDIDVFESKKHFLRYADRYVRRPPIAQYRFVKITDREVQFWTKDKIQKQRVYFSYTPEEFVAILAEQVSDRYRHAIRYFTSGYWRLVQKHGPPLPYLCYWGN